MKGQFSHQMLLPRLNHFKHIAMAMLIGSLVSASSAAQEPTPQQKINKTISNLKYYAEAGNHAAQYRLAQEYFQGRYLAKNHQLGLKWATKAAEGGDSTAQIGMGALHHFGEGIVKPDYEKAMYWYQKAAEGYEALAYTYIGLLYHDGLGVKKNNELALHWITRGAENGDAFGQAVLGSMYLNGATLPRDYKKANYWLTKSADNNDSLGEYNLGKMFELGLGMERNQEKAVHWYKKAAAQGHPEAQRDLDEIMQSSSKTSKNDAAALATSAKDFNEKTQTTKSANNNKQVVQPASLSQTNPLQGVPPGSYALQLMAAKEAGNAIAFEDKYKINGQIWQYDTADTTWYLLIEGVYANRESGQRAQMLLPPLPKWSKPWLRSVGSLQKKDMSVRILPADQ